MLFFPSDPADTTESKHKKFKANLSCATSIFTRDYIFFEHVKMLLQQGKVIFDSTDVAPYNVERTKGALSGYHFPFSQTHALEKQEAVGLAALY